MIKFSRLTVIRIAGPRAWQFMHEWRGHILMLAPVSWPLETFTQCACEKRLELLTLMP